MVCVEMIAFLFCPSANRTAGTRYASDLPTPVPASTTRCRSSSSARATAAAICCCGGRRSKFFALARSPFAEKNDSVVSTKSGPMESRNAIIALTRAYSGFSPFGKAIRGPRISLGTEVQPSFRLKARRNTDLQICAPSGVALRCTGAEKADRMSAWRTGRRPMFRRLPIARRSFQFHSHYWRRVARLPFNRN